MTTQTLYDLYMKKYLLDLSGEQPALMEQQTIGTMGQHIENLLQIAQAHAAIMNGTAQRRVSLQNQPAPIINVPK